MRISVIGAMAIMTGLAPLTAARAVVYNTFTAPGRSPRAFSRQDGSEEELTFDGLIRYVNISLGTPPQPLALHFDTGSSDMWVPSIAPGSSMCDTSSCGSLGAYDKTRSSTYEALTNMSTFKITYGDGTQVSGDWFQDALEIGDDTLVNVTLALGMKGSSHLLLDGLMGVGYQSLESHLWPAHRVGDGGCEDLEPYTNIIGELQEQGVIDTLAYGIWTNDFRIGDGQVSFGAIDNAKFEGELTVVPVVQSDKLPCFSDKSRYSRHLVHVLSVTFTPGDGGGDAVILDRPEDPINHPATLLLDTGNSHIQLPEKWTERLYQHLQLEILDGSPLVHCEDYPTGKLTIQFGRTEINVPMSQLVRPALWLRTPPVMSDGSEACSLNMIPTGPFMGGIDGILGDPFFSAAYVAIDQTNHEIGLAQSRPNTAKEVDLVVMKDKIPGRRAH